MPIVTSSTVPIAQNPQIRPNTISQARTGLVMIVYIVLFLISVGRLKALKKRASPKIK